MSEEKLLLTPGPLTTSKTVKEAMLRDVCSWDAEFIALVRQLRRRLVALSGMSDDYTAILMQCSGTFGLEAVISSTVPADGRLLVIVDGAYGRRALGIAAVLGIRATALTRSEKEKPTARKVEALLEADGDVTHVVIVHCETTTGIVNPVEAIGAIVKSRRLCYIVDVMSSFGAVPLGSSRGRDRLPGLRA